MPAVIDSIQSIDTGTIWILNECIYKSICIFLVICEQASRRAKFHSIKKRYYFVASATVVIVIVVVAVAEICFFTPTDQQALHVATTAHNWRQLFHVIYS